MLDEPGMKHSVVFKERYDSQLGPLDLLLKSTAQGIKTAPGNSFFVTAGHETTIKQVTPKPDWLPPKLLVESTTAWMFYIRKFNASEEQLSVSLERITADSAMQSGGAGGQHLIAIEIENGIRQLHIGTEDEVAMAGRAAKNDWMPPRFEGPLMNYELEITTVTSLGLATQIPRLNAGEQFYFHYLIAENPCRQSAEYPDESDASTWFAVDQSKKQLEQTLGAKA